MNQDFNREFTAEFLSFGVVHSEIDRIIVGNNELKEKILSFVPEPQRSEASKKIKVDTGHLSHPHIDVRRD